MCGTQVIDDIAGEVHHGRVDRRTVVIVAYPGVQSLDVAGPFEVFAGAGLAAAAVGTAASSYDVRLVSPAQGGFLGSIAMAEDLARATPWCSPAAGVWATPATTPASWPG